MRTTATPDDFKALAAMHVDVRGAIVLARVGGGGALTGKAFEARQTRREGRAVVLRSDDAAAIGTATCIRTARTALPAARCATR